MRKNDSSLVCDIPIKVGADNYDSVRRLHEAFADGYAVLN